MQKNNLLLKGSILLSICAVLVFASIHTPKVSLGEEENEMYDGPELAMEFEIERTKDPSLGRVPRERLVPAIEITAASKEVAVRDALTLMRPAAPAAAQLKWSERGPNSDSTGPSNGNTRANGGVTAGRIRAIMVDASFPSGNVVWVGGIDGGLWKTADISASPATWTLISDRFSNMAVSDIFQQPGSPDTIYFATGEGYFNADGVNGNGVFKSTDHGVTWTQLASTSSLTCTRITGDSSGNLYLGTQNNGVQRSVDGGATWTVITPSGSSSRIADLRLSSTGRLHVTTGLGNSSIGVYRYTDTPTTVSAATWTAASTPFPYPSGANCRVEIGVSGNTLYALPSNTSAQVPTIYRSSDGGATWAAVTAPNSTWASGQAWYALTVAINPNDPNQVIVGGLDTWKSINGGSTWTQMSTWVGTTPVNQFVHADVHKSIWYDDGNRILFGSDGGIFYSTDAGASFRDRNVGLRIKQFYSVAMHPTLTDYFLAGAQDNGSHQFTNAGLSSSVEVKGGDGAFVAIDQNEPQFQFVSYVRNQYRRSTNGGSTWSNVDFSSSTGQFINPFDYDSAANVMYCGDTTSSYRRWTDPQTGSTSSVVSVSNMTGSVTAVSVSPYTANRVYFGTNSGKVVRVDSANTFASGSAGTDLSTGLPSGTVSNINFGTDDNNLIAVFSNYGINNIWVSTNGGTTWTASDGNLPDMPVRWAIFAPGDNTRAYIATETGVWETAALAGAGTVWVSNTTFPIVRTDMIKYRAGDHTFAAATHGRGLWTARLGSSAVSDFDGDGKSDTAVWREPVGSWFETFSSNSLFNAAQFGQTGDKIVPGDYDGDGKTDVAVWRPTGGVWYLMQSSAGFSAIQFGLSTDQPVQGDFDGDGKTDIAVWRPSTGTWFIMNSSNGVVTATQFGLINDKPVPGDYDGDGKTDVAVYRPSSGNWFLLRSSLGFTAQQFGIPTDKVAPADYDGDGKTDIAVYRDGVPGVWYLMQSSAGFTAMQFGTLNDVPVPGDYDGDGKADISVWRPSAGDWYEQRSTSGFAAFHFGQAGDKPVPSAYVPLQ